VDVNAGAWTSAARMVRHSAAMEVTDDRFRTLADTVV